MKSTVSVLTTPTVDTPGSSVVLSFEDKNYLFGNVHEGMQRTCIQNGTRLLKLNDLFLTGKTEWRTTGGIMGFILTVADVMQGAAEGVKETILEAQRKWEQRLKDAPSDKERERISKTSQPKEKLEGIEKPRLSIHGPDNVMQLLATARRFIFRRGLPLSIYEHGNSTSNAKPTWEDSNIRVWAMPLRPQSESSHSDHHSPQKRSSEQSVESLLVPENEFDPSENDRQDKLKGVIASMFDSDWRMDALFETPLAEVQLPAKLFVRNSKTKALEQYNGPMPGSGQDISGIHVLVRRPWPGALVANLPETRPSNTIMSYIVTGQPRRGKFDAAMAKSLGIPPGPEFRKLANGEAVKNADGVTITSDQVCGPLRNGRGFAVIEIPTIDYIPSLKASFAFNNHEIMQDIEAIFWLVGANVTQDAAFQEIIQERPMLKHVLSSPDHCANHLTIDAAAAAQLRHRVIDKERFSIPLHNNERKALPRQLSECIIAERGQTLTLEPEVKMETKMEPALLNTLDVLRKVNGDVKRLAEEARGRIESPEFQQVYQNQNLPAEDAEIITLGTGSAAPSKQRNVSATLIRVPGVGSYLLDAGENTMGQLSRLYAPEELKEVLRDLKLVWISHMHADHHLGLASVIKAWHTAVYGDPETNKQQSPRLLYQMSDPAKYLVDRQKLCIVAEREMLHWLEEYSDIEEFGYNMILPLHVVPHRNSNGSPSTALYWHRQSVGFGLPNSANNAPILQSIRQATGLSDLQAVGVVHCAGARAVSMTWPNGLKISYSGDCRPSGKFAKIGVDSTVLIHEATFDDALIGDAKAKRHTTTREAIGVGMRMRARRIILTHFSQRYSKLPELENVIARPVAFEDAEVDSAEVMTDERGNGDTNGPSENTKDDTGSEPGQTGSMTASTDAAVRPITLEGQSAIDVETAKNVKIGVAFDLMRVKIKDIMVLDQFNPAFQSLYDDSSAADLEKLARKAAADEISQKREEEKKIRQEQRRQQQMAESALKRKSSRSSIRSARSIRAVGDLDTPMQGSVDVAESIPQAHTSNVPE